MLSRLITTLGLIAGLYPAAALAADRPIVVELYTSQGCSSCPPANAYLNELSRDRRDVLPLAFHVTYWDRLGWKDPYSLQAATDRQDQYGHRFGDGSYTPEIVVDGATGLVGSHRHDVGSAIEKAKRESRAAASVSVTKNRGGHGLLQRLSRNATPQIHLTGFDHDQTQTLKPVPYRGLTRPKHQNISPLATQRPV